MATHTVQLPSGPLRGNSGRPSGLRTYCRRLFRPLFERYRPERYYMRGPGPRWRAKHPGEQTIPAE